MSNFKFTPKIAQWLSENEAALEQMDKNIWANFGIDYQLTNQQETKTMTQMHPIAHVQISKTDDIELIINTKRVLSWARHPSFPNMTDRERRLISQMVEAGVEHGKKLKAQEIRNALDEK